MTSSLCPDCGMCLSEKIHTGYHARFLRACRELHYVPLHLPADYEAMLAETFPLYNTQYASSSRVTAALHYARYLYDAKILRTIRYPHTAYNWKHLPSFDAFVRSQEFLARIPSEVASRLASRKHRYVPPEIPTPLPDWEDIQMEETSNPHQDELQGIFAVVEEILLSGRQSK